MPCIAITPCRVCTSRRTDVSATAPPEGGLWALPRSSTWPDGHRCAGGQVAFSCRPARGGCSPPPTLASRLSQATCPPPYGAGSAGVAPNELQPNLVRKRPWLVRLDSSAPPPGCRLDRGWRPHKCGSRSPVAGAPSLRPGPNLRLPWARSSSSPLPCYQCTAHKKARAKARALKEHILRSGRWSAMTVLRYV